MLGHICCQDHVNDGGTHGTILCSVRVKGWGERSEDSRKDDKRYTKEVKEKVGKVRKQ